MRKRRKKKRKGDRWKQRKTDSGNFVGNELANGSGTREITFRAPLDFRVPLKIILT